MIAPVRFFVTSATRLFKRVAFALSCKVVTRFGFSVVQIVERAGTEYMVANDGSLLRIGGKVKVRK